MAGQGRNLQSSWLESGITFERLYTANGGEASPLDTTVWGDWFFEAATIPSTVVPIFYYHMQQQGMA